MCVIAFSSRLDILTLEGLALYYLALSQSCTTMLIYNALSSTAISINVFKDC